MNIDIMELPKNAEIWQILAYSKLECTSTYYPEREPFEGTVARLCE